MRVEPHEGLIPLKKRPPRAPQSLLHSKKSPAMNQEESQHLAITIFTKEGLLLFWCTNTTISLLYFDYVNHFCHFSVFFHLYHQYIYNFRIPAFKQTLDEIIQCTRLLTLSYLPFGSYTCGIVYNVLPGCKDLSFYLMLDSYHEQLK